MGDDLKTSRIRATTLGDLLLTAADKNPDKQAVILSDQRITYAELAEQSLTAARALRALGVESGDHVGLLLPTCVEFLEAMFAASLIGAVVVPINARFRAPEIAYVCKNADLTAILTSNKFKETIDFFTRLDDALPGLRSRSNSVALGLNEFPLLSTLR